MKGSFLCLLCYVVFFFYIKSVKFDDINVMNVYLLCGFNIFNDIFICLVYYKYI